MSPELARLTILIGTVGGYLFDAARFARHIEAAYAAMWERSQRGEPPESFAVEPIPD